MTDNKNSCKKNRERVRTRKVLALFVLMAISILAIGIYTYYTREAEITIIAEDKELLMGEDIPELTVQVQLKGNRNAFINRKEKYTAGDLIRDLEKEGAYTLECDADGQREGEYAVKVVLNDQLKKIKRKGFLKVQDGILKVKNPVGNWEGEKFLKYDGSYVTNEFVVSNENTYYLNAEGLKVYGWQLINEQYYFFDSTGVMLKDSWQTSGSDTYYLTSAGVMAVGWLDIEGATYCFDETGRMLRGQHFLGIALCTFDETGKLIDKTASIIDPNKPMIALTFDDGPGKRTNELLDALEKNHARATFFMLGSNIDKYPDVLKKMQTIGCELGNHSYNHPNLKNLSAEEIKSQMDMTNEKIRGITGSPATVMRPPYGAISDVVKANVGLPMILWNIDTLDWETRDVNLIKESIIGKVKDGDIILLHDIHTETIDAAIELIPMLQEEGFQLVTVSEMAAMKGVQMKAGEKYTDF